MATVDLTAIVVQTIVTVGLVLVAVLPVLVSNRRKSARAEVAAHVAATAATKAQTATALTTDALTNSHSEHLREQMDRQHKETTDAIQGLTAEVKSVRRDQDGMKADLRLIRQGQESDRERIHDLERTQPVPPRAAPRRRKPS